MNDWSTPDDVKKRVRREWESGRILAALLADEPIFPLRISLKKPNTQALSECFEDARQWISGLQQGAQAGYELEWMEFNHRQLGRNRIPVAARINSERDALNLLGKQRETQRFRALAARILTAYPALFAWLKKRPLTVLEQTENWPRLLAVLGWVVSHPNANIYLRQIDALGVDSKFIEAHRGLLSELLDCVLPPEAIHRDYSGANGFELRYGFKRKPSQVRFRFLDTHLYIQGCSDLTVTSTEFAQLVLPIKQVFMTENEINFLAFPDIAGSIVIFGSGYGFDYLAASQWLQDTQIYYWGDLDTHGFAILDQLRSQFPAAHSILMNRATLLAHQDFWGQEAHPTTRQLTRLQADESALYDDLRFDRIARALRLEQERIGFAWLRAELEKAGF